MKNQELDVVREEGLRRYRIIVPLLEEGLAECEKRSLRRWICAQERISGRTLRRYMAAFKRRGFDGLLPRERKDKGTCKAIVPEALQLALELRQELPGRSAERIQQLLAGEGFAVARSTLERQLRPRGLSGREMAASQKSTASRRFNRVGRNTLWQADLKYGPYLPDPRRPGHKMRTYLLAMIDDATRLVVHGQFYLNQKLPVLRINLRKAFLRCGVPDNLYVDNGKNLYFSMAAAGLCQNCGTGICIPGPISPQSKGKI
jgi:hypothetical protein